MGNNAAAQRSGGAYRNGKTIALSADHAKHPPTPNPFEATCKNSMFWKAYRLNGANTEELPYTGKVPDDKPLTDAEIERMATRIKPHGTVHGEGIRLHECFKFTAGAKYRIVAEFPPLPNRGDDWESIEFEL